MKRGRLSKAEKLYLEQTTDSLEDAAQKLGRSVDAISKYYVGVPPTPPSEPTAEPQVRRNIDEFVTQSSEKKEKGVVVMTESASQRGDYSKKSSTKRPVFTDAITQIQK